MRLLDKPFDEAQNDDALKMLGRCICRICVSDDPEEIVSMLGFATDYLSMLAYSRINGPSLRQKWNILIYR